MFCLIDRLGRRYLMLRSLPFMGLSMLLIGFSFYLIRVAEVPGAKWLCLLSMGLYLAFFVLGMSGTPQTVNGEIYPLPLRATANSLALVARCLSDFVVASAFLSATKTDTGSVSKIDNTYNYN